VETLLVWQICSVTSKKFTVVFGTALNRGAAGVEQNGREDLTPIY
jgi:hypothetical protein